MEGCDDEETVLLVANDGKTIETPANVASKSVLVSTMMEMGQEIPLPNVDHATLAKIVQFMQLLADGNTPTTIPRPLQHVEFESNVQPWEADFIDVDDTMLFAILHAANYMDVDPLIELASAKLASFIKGRSPDEIRRRFGVVNDFSPAEEERLREEHRWCEEL